MTTPEVLPPPMPQQDQNTPKTRKNEIFLAVHRNDVATLRLLLDSPNWYNIRNDQGHTLLQVAMQKNSAQVFDYMLSLVDFPLEFENSAGQTALICCLSGGTIGFFDPYRIEEYYAVELIKKGASIGTLRSRGYSPLHSAIAKLYLNVVKILIEMGEDVNTCNNQRVSPLETALSLCSRNSFKAINSAVVTQIVDVLLLAGAIPTMRHFEMSVLYNMTEMQSIFFLYVFDEFTTKKISFYVLIKLASDNNSLFEEVMKWGPKLKMGDTVEGDFFPRLCSMSFEYLELLFEKFPSFLEKLFLSTLKPTVSLVKCMSLKNLAFMLESPLKFSIIDYVNCSEITTVVGDLLDSKHDALTEKICFFASYFNLFIGLEDLQEIYKNFGYGELFKIALHFDITLSHHVYLRGFYDMGNFFTILLCDINTSLETFLMYPEKYTESSVVELMGFFVDVRLKAIHDEYADRGRLTRVQDIPKVPLLQEMARNQFRKLKHLPGRYKNVVPIIAYEKKLYDTT